MSVPVSPEVPLILPVASLMCLALAPVVAWFLVRRKAGAASCLVACGALALLAASVWTVGQVPVPNPLERVAAPSPSQAREIFHALHGNLYSAFDARNENDIYDALATSVDGPLLQQLYLNIRRGLEVEEEGGAATRVRTVTILEGQRLGSSATNQRRDRRAFVYACRWTIDADVRHWGHMHQRKNGYQARFTIMPCDGVWKITDLEAWEEERGELQTTPI